MSKEPERTKRLAKKSFESWAGHYDRSLLHYFLFGPCHFQLLTELAGWQREYDRSLDLLDIGCGTGTLAHLVDRANLKTRQIVGLDYAMEMCSQAGAKAADTHTDGRCCFVNGDSEHLPFPDGCFDAVTCANSFHHYPHQQSVVNEMRRVLRPDGQLMIVDGFRDNCVGWFVFDVIITAVEKAVYHVPWEVMRSYFQEAGFRDIRHKKFNFLFPALLTVGRA